MLPYRGYLPYPLSLQAYFSHDGNITTYEGTGQLEGPQFFIIVRNLKGGPPFCECANCPKPPPPPPTPAPGPPPPRYGRQGVR